jgi:hypothetical protein
VVVVVVEMLDAEKHHRDRDRDREARGARRREMPFKSKKTNKTETVEYMKNTNKVIGFCFLKSTLLCTKLSHRKITPRK